MLNEFWSELRYRIRAILRRADLEQDLDDELRFHIELEAGKYVALGLSREEAEWRARAAFGGLDQIKEAARDVRAVRPFEDLWRDLRLAVRRLVREPSYSVPTVLTLALGIAVGTAVLTMVNAILLRPLPYEDADRLVEVRHAAPGGDLAVTGLSPGMFLHYRNQNRSFEDIAVYLEHAGTLTEGDAPEQVRVALVSASLFTVLRATPHLGRFPTVAELASGARSGAVISHDLWVRRYAVTRTSLDGRSKSIVRRM